MSTRYAITFRLQPTKAQRKQFCVFSGCCRWVWNECLSKQLEQYKETGKGLHTFEFANNLKQIKEENEFLKDCDSQALQQRLSDLNKSWQKFFRQDQAGDGKPKFRIKGIHDTFRFPQRVKLATDGKPYVYLPKIGWVKFRQSRDINGVVKQATIRRKGSQWDVTFTIEGELHTQKKDIKTCGIDRGVTETIVTSHEEVFHWQTSEPLKDHIKDVQRKLSRQKKGSNSRAKTKRQLGNLRRKQANFRKDSIHKATTVISQNHARVAVEDLKVRNMTRSAKGTIENPGKNVKAKSGLNREILDRGWGVFERCLEYKMAGRQGEFVKVNPAFTSQDCSCCGKRGKRDKKMFHCPNCNITTDADVNAARNVEYKAFGAGHALVNAGKAA